MKLNDCETTFLAICVALTVITLAMIIHIYKPKDVKQTADRLTVRIEAMKSAQDSDYYFKKNTIKEDSR